jgi:ribonuclease R
MTISRKQILQQMERVTYHPMLLRELMRSFGISKQDRRRFQRLLEEMVQGGEIAKIKGNRYGLPEKMNLVPGRLQGHPEGYGFVVPDQSGQGDVYIPRRNMLDALHGDRVMARVEHVHPSRIASGGLRREGRIIRVLERGKAQVVGRFQWMRGREFGFVVPTDRRNWYDIYIPSDESMGSMDNDLVITEILRYPTPHRNPEGRIQKILGQAYDPKIDTEMVIAEFALPTGFPKNVMAETGTVPDRVAPSMFRGRQDLRGLKTVTIDGEKARDYDDAVSIESLPQGQCRLWVHIADVAQYVPWESMLDLEARERGTSVYFPDQVIPMFPEKLSNGICSLNPHEDRLTVSVEMKFDANGNRLSYDLYETVIKSNERMTYSVVAKILENDDPVLSQRYHSLVSDFVLMRDLAERLRALRMRSGSIDFDLPEPEIILDLQGQPLDIVREERNVAHRIIEEFMIAANRVVAEHLSQKGVPMIYRIHEPPVPEKIEDLTRFIASFGHVLEIPGRKGGVAGKRLSPKVLQALLERVKGRPEERLINHVVLRSMKQARYSVENMGHFGLAAEHYTHFTSPIRRYPDLVVHRLVKDILHRESLRSHRRSQLPQLLLEVTRSCSERERVAMEAERESVDLKKVRFMDDKVGEEFYGFITGVTAFGFFIELESIFVEGLVHITSIPDDYYIFLEKEHCLIGRHHRRRFRIGDRMKVRIDRVDLQKRKIDFTLTGEVLQQRRRAKVKRRRG